MSRHGERNAARHWIGNRKPQLAPGRWCKTGPSVHHAIGQRLKANYDDAVEALPSRLEELLAELHRLQVPAKPEP